MNRVCFTLQVKPSRLAEYREHHANVWPEMREALQRNGWHNYSLFLRDDGLLIGYFETPGSLEDAVDAMNAEPINARWQELMAPFFDNDGTHADKSMSAIPQVFFLS